MGEITNLYPDKSSGGYPLTNQAGPRMTPTPLDAHIDSAVQQASTAAPQGRGFFAKIGAGLRAIAPLVQPAAAHLAAAFGNRAPLADYEKQTQLQTENALRQSQSDMQQRLGESTLATGAENLKKLQFENANAETPAQKEAGALKQAGLLLQQTNALKAPTDITGENDEGKLGHYGQSYDPATKTWVVKPTMAQPPPAAPGQPQQPARQLLLNPKLSRGTPYAGNDGKMHVPFYNAQGHLDHEETPDGKPYSALPTTTTGVSTGLKPDGMGGMVPVQLPHSSTRSTLMPGGAGGSTGAPPPSRSPGAPPAASQGNFGVKVGSPVMSAPAPKPVTDAFNTYNQSQERFNVMSKALPEALHGDQQAMLNLLANHLGMTMGLQKGARMNQQLIEEAMKSTPWLQGLQARFDDRGYLTGVTLTPEQMQSMVSLGKDRMTEDLAGWQRAQGAARTNFGMSSSPGAPNPMPSAPSKIIRYDAQGNRIP